MPPSGFFMLILKGRYGDWLGIFDVLAEEYNRPCRLLGEGLCLIWDLRGIGGAKGFWGLL